MKYYRDSFLLLGIAVLFILLLLLVFSAFQNKYIYNHTLGKISCSEHMVNGEIQYVKEPFLPITNENLRHWDVQDYEKIKNDGYAKKLYFLYAFYPLFPYIWQISQLDIRQVCLLNYFFYILGILILFKSYCSTYGFKEKAILFIMLISIPSSVVFMMPYSEAVFFLALSVAVWGYLNKRYWLFFVFLILASMTRRASFLLLAASVISSVLLFVRHRNPRLFLADLFQLSLPLLIGTAIVSIIQYMSGSGSFFTFIEVTGTWSKEFSFPIALYDWSHNSYPLNMAVLFTFLPLVFISILIFLFKSFRTSNVTINLIDHRKESIALVAGGYFAAAIAFILFYQGGSLNSTFRGIVCTPFFIIALFYIKQQFTRPLYFNILLIVLVIIDSFFFFKGQFTASPLRFSYLSQLLFITLLFVWFNLEKIALARFLYIPLFVWLVLSLTLIGSYFNAFLGNGWIFT